MWKICCKYVPKNRIVKFFQRTVSGVHHHTIVAGLVWSIKKKKKKKKKKKTYFVRNNNKKKKKKKLHSVLQKRKKSLHDLKNCSSGKKLNIKELFLLQLDGFTGLRIRTWCLFITLINFLCVRFYVSSCILSVLNEGWNQNYSK